MNEKKLLIIGAGGHAKVVADAVDDNKYEIVGMLDKDDGRIGDFVNGIPIIGTDHAAELFYGKGITNAVIGIGHMGDSHLRNAIFARLKNIGFLMVNVIHKTAFVSKDVVMGEGNVILPHVTINSGAQIGNNNIINTGAILEHEVELGNNVHMAPGTIVCGASRIGDHTFIGAGSTIIQGLTIGNNVLVGAGSTVINSVQDNSLLYGTPAKTVKRR